MFLEVYTAGSNTKFFSSIQFSIFKEYAVLLVLVVETTLRSNFDGNCCCTKCFMISVLLNMG